MKNNAEKTALLATILLAPLYADRMRQSSIFTMRTVDDAIEMAWAIVERVEERCAFQEKEG